jgi:LPS-assembly protein
VRNSFAQVWRIEEGRATFVLLRMTARIRLFTTPAVACQLFLLVWLLTTALRGFAQTQPSAAEETTPAPATDSSVPPAATVPMEQSSPPEPPVPRPTGDEVIIKARQQEKAGDVFTLRGEVEVYYRDVILHADEITYDQSTGDVIATGHVIIEGGPHNEHIEGTHAEYNVRTETGKFYDAQGTVGLKLRGSKRAQLTSENPFAVSGKIVEKAGPDRYIVHHGSVTSCKMPNPKWTFNAHRVVIEVGDTAKIFNSTFRVKRVPVFYFPFTRHSVSRRPRQSGFLMPSFGTSSQKGTTLGEAFYWAINRSMDATLGAEYWSSRGWAQHAQFRAVPNDHSSLTVQYFGVLDRVSTPPLPNQGGQYVQLMGETMLPHNIRGVAALEYLSSYLFRQSFSETYFQAINSEVKSVAFLTKNYSGFSYNASASRYQNFQSTTPGDDITILHAPTADVSGVDRQMGDSRFYWSFDASGGGLSRHEPTFDTADLVGRMDLFPRVSLPLVLHGWTLRPEVGVRDTFYTQRRLPTGGIGTTASASVNRKAVEGTFELRSPGISRVFQRPWFNHRLKHTLQPRAVYRYVEGVNNFANIIRFDARDIYTNANELQLGVVTKLYSKRLDPNCPSEKVLPLSDSELLEETRPVTATVQSSQNCQAARELLSWELGEKFYFNRGFGGALVPGARNVFTSTVDYTGIAFLSEPRRQAPVISRMRIHPNVRSVLEWSLDYDTKKGRISSSSVIGDYHLGEYFFGAGHTYLVTTGEALSLTAPVRFNQVRLLSGFGHPNKPGITMAGSIGVDLNLNSTQYSALQTTYNWDCCGITAEFRRIAIGPVRSENQFRFAFTVANVGTFGTLKRQERLY